MAFQWWAQRGEPAAHRVHLPSRTPTTATRSERSRSAGSSSSTPSTDRCCSTPGRRAPGDAEDLAELLERHGERIAAVIIEPLVQGAAGMLLQPRGYLRAVRELCDAHGVLLICDEVATGFGRTGRMFACDHEDVTPDLLCVGKGITGGYLPLAATLTTERIYEGFLGRPEELHDVLPRPHLHRQPARVRGRRSRRLELFEREQTLERLAAEDRAARAHARAPGRRRFLRSPRCASAGSWSGSSSAARPGRARSATR